MQDRRTGRPSLLQDDLLARATRQPLRRGRGQADLYTQLDRPEADAYAIAVEVMVALSQSPGARGGMAAFLEKRRPVWPD